MGRLVIIILGVVFIALLLLHIRREEAALRHDVQQSLTRQMTLRRTLWDQRMEIANLVAPAEIRRRAREMTLNLTQEDESRSDLARRKNQARTATER